MTHLLYRNAVDDSPRVIMQDDTVLDKWWLCVLLPDGVCVRARSEVGVQRVEVDSPNFGVLRVTPFESARYVMVGDKVRGGDDVIRVIAPTDVTGRIIADGHVVVRDSANQEKTVDDWAPQDAEQITPHPQWSMRAPLLSSLAKFPKPAIDVEQLRRQGWDEFIDPTTGERAPPTQEEADALVAHVVESVSEQQQIPAPMRFLLAWIAALLPRRVDGDRRSEEVLRAITTLATLPNSTPLLAETLRLLAGPVPMANRRGVRQAIDQYNLPIEIDNLGGVSVPSTRWRWDSSSLC